MLAETMEKKWIQYFGTERWAFCQHCCGQTIQDKDKVGLWKCRACGRILDWIGRVIRLHE